MTIDIPNLIERLKSDWGTPREATHRGALCPFKLHCAFSPPAMKIEIDAIKGVPKAVIEFWGSAGSADLFKDRKYGQWGLRILGPSEALCRTRELCEERPRDSMIGDLIVGAFYGDSDLLIIRTDKNAIDYGTVIVALPLDPRNDWDIVSNSFDIFLKKYVESHGDKFWELR